jgi:hypothetical protein
MWLSDTLVLLNQLSVVILKIWQTTIAALTKVLINADNASFPSPVARYHNDRYLAE